MPISICSAVRKLFISGVSQGLVGRLKRNTHKGVIALGRGSSHISASARKKGMLLKAMGSAGEMMMKIQKDKEKKFIKGMIEYKKELKGSNHEYLSRHPELEKFDMPKTFYFRYLPDRRVIHWAIIKGVNKVVNVRANNEVVIYFINNWGRVFDKIECKNIKIARRRLRRNGFDFSTNKYCPYTPPEPIYIKLSEGRKSAPYSKGNLWQSVQRTKNHNNVMRIICKEFREEYKAHTEAIKDPVGDTTWNLYRSLTGNNKEQPVGHENCLGRFIRTLIHGVYGCAVLYLVLVVIFYFVDM